MAEREGDGRRSAALVAAGIAGAAAIFETGRRIEATVIGVAIAAGVLWSNGLAYSNAWLAPRGALAELQTIGARYAGAGADADHRYRALRHPAFPPEDGSGVAVRASATTRSAAERPRHRQGRVRRPRRVPARRHPRLQDPRPPRSPVASRPSSAYQLVWRGRYYDVWQRPDSYQAIGEHLPLGDAPSRQRAELQRRPAPRAARRPGAASSRRPEHRS